MSGFDIERGNWPTPGYIPPSTCFLPHDDENTRRALSLYDSKHKITMNRVKLMLAAVEKELDRDIKQYEDLKAFGNNVVSDYDLSMGYTAENTCLPLKYNHISYHKGQLACLKAWLADKPKQSALFGE